MIRLVSVLLFLIITNDVPAQRLAYATASATILNAVGAEELVAMKAENTIVPIPQGSVSVSGGIGKQTEKQVGSALFRVLGNGFIYSLNVSSAATLIRNGVANQTAVKPIDGAKDAYIIGSLVATKSTRREENRKEGWVDVTINFN